MVRQGSFRLSQDSCQVWNNAQFRQVQEGFDFLRAFYPIIRTIEKENEPYRCYRGNQATQREVHRFLWTGRQRWRYCSLGQRNIRERSLSIYADLLHALQHVLVQLTVGIDFAHENRVLQRSVIARKVLLLFFSNSLFQLLLSG